MTEAAEEPAVPVELIERLVEEARERGELHLDAAMMSLGIELTPDVLTALKSACRKADVRLDEGVETLDEPEPELSPADELARARKRRAAAAKALKAVKSSGVGSSD